MHLLKQSTAATVIVGPVLDSSGAAVTTAVVGDFRLAKEGTSAVLSGATVTHDANGYYLIALTTTNTNTVGRLAIYSNNTSQSMGTTRFMVLLASVYDALVTNATNTTGGLPAATGAISALAGAVSTYAGGDTAGTTTLLTRLPSAISLSGGAVTVGTNNDKTGYSLTQAFPSNFSSLAITGGGAVTAGTVSDKTGYSLNSTGLAAVTSWTVGITGNITGNVSGSVGSISGVTFPTHFDNLDITANGHVTATVDSIANNAITASSIQANAITAAKIASDAIGAAQLAADAVTEIQSGLATASALATLTGYVDTEVAAIKVVTDKLNTGLVQDGAVYQFTANMLELAPAGGGGAGDASQATLLEVQDTVESIAASLSGVPITASGRIADGGTITLYCGDDLRVRSGSQITITVTDVGGAIFARLDGIGTANLFWGASRQGLPASAISGSIASISQSGSGASQTLSIVVEIDNAGSSLKPAEDYKWQIESQQDHGAETDSVVEMEGLLSLRRRVV